MNVASPCTSVCKMDSESKLCVGCWRTIDEIVAWSSNSDEEKKKVWALIALRKNGVANLDASSTVSSGSSENDKTP
ncbi:MAG: DUF1289 domain-containing protein [Burkholderiaceae bacterium]